MSNSRAPKVTTINLFNMSVQDKILLGQLLSTSAADVLKKNTSYPITPTDSIQLSHELVRRYKMIGRKKIPRYSIISNSDEDILGAGAKGSVSIIPGTIIIDENNQAQLDRSKKLVVKKQQHGLLFHTSNKAVEESIKLANIRHSQKRTTIDTSSRFFPTSYTFDTLMSTSLQGLINQEIHDHPTRYKLLPAKKIKYKITYLKRLQISINCLRALQNFHDAGYIHYDIKPDNIVLDKKSLKVNIADCGSASHHSKAGLFAGGSHSYVSPERIVFWRFPITKYVDHYAMGLSLLDLWGGKTRSLRKDERPYNYDDYKTSKRHFREAVRQITFHERDVINVETIGNFTKIPKAFNELDEASYLESNELVPVKLAITKLLAFDPRNRCTLQESIDAFETIRCKHLYRNRPEQENALQAITLAYKLKQALKENINFNKLGDMSKIYNIFTDGLSLLGDSKTALKEFKRVLEIDVMDAANSKDEIITKLSDIINNYSKNILAFKNIHDQLISTRKLLNHASRLDDAMQAINKILYRYHKKKTSLDDLERFNQEFSKNINGIKLAIKQFDKTEFTHADEQIMILRELTISENTSQEDSLKNNIKLAIRAYLLDTYKQQNIAKHDRAASSRRLADMRNILNITEQNLSAVELKSKLLHSVKSIKTGFFGRSELRDNIKEALSNHPSTPNKQA